jgi:hypothetical protein
VALLVKDECGAISHEPGTQSAAGLTRIDVGDCHIRRPQGCRTNGDHIVMPVAAGIPTLQRASTESGACGVSLA